MTLTEFNNLSLTHKADIVWEWGYYISSKQYGNHTIALFVLGNFFTEVYISTLSNKTDLIKGIDKTELNSDFVSSLNTEDPLIKAVFTPQTKSSITSVFHN